MSVINMLPLGGGKSNVTPIYAPNMALEGNRSYRFTRDYKHVVAIYFSGSNANVTRTVTGAFTNAKNVAVLYNKGSGDSNGGANMLVMEGYEVKANSTFTISGTGYAQRGLYIFAIG